jgi:hypothetical protein
MTVSPYRTNSGADADRIVMAFLASANGRWLNLARETTNVRHPVLFALGTKAAILAVLVVGCGGPVVEAPTAALKGKITKGGQPLPVNTSMGAYAYVEAILIPPGGGAPYTTRVAADGSFAVELAEGASIPPGQYRVAVRQWEPYPQTDKLGGRFDEKNTQIVVTVAAPPKELVIDLDKPGG